MNQDDFLALLLNGGSLSTAMVPDPIFPGNRPEHLESYQLPFILLNQNGFWAISREKHRRLLEQNAGLADRLEHFFFYSAGKQTIFGSGSTRNSRIMMMLIKRYKTFNWCIKSNYQVVWDSQDTASKCVAIREALAQGRDFKVMIKRNELTSFLPVDLLQVDKDDEHWLLRTQSLHVPSLFLQAPQDEQRDLLDISKGFADDDTSHIAERRDEFKVHWYLIDSHGQATDYYQGLEQKSDVYERVILYAESDDANIDVINRLDLESLFLK